MYNDGAMKVEDGDIKKGTDLLIKEYIKIKEKKHLENLLKDNKNRIKNR